MYVSNHSTVGCHFTWGWHSLLFSEASERYVDCVIKNVNQRSDVVSHLYLVLSFTYGKIYFVSVNIHVHCICNIKYNITVNQIYC